MEANSQQQTKTNSHTEALISQIRELYGRIVYTHKTQEKCADIINKRNNCLKNLQLFLSIFTTTGIISRIFTGEDWVLVVAVVLSAAQFGINSYLKEHDLGKIAQRHTDAALDLLNVRETYLSLLTDLYNNKISYEEAITIRDRLQTETVTVFRSAPRTFEEAYEAASKGLKEMEEFTFTDQEIDKFLPEVLRKKKQ